MTKRQTKPRQSICELSLTKHERVSDHERIHSWGAGSPPEFTQAPGRHRPRLLCPYRLDGSIVGPGEKSACDEWVAAKYMRVGGLLVRKQPTTFVTPLGEFRGYIGASAQVGRAADEAGVPKGSAIRTAMLTEMPVRPFEVSVDPVARRPYSGGGVGRAHGGLWEPRTGERSAEVFVSNPDASGKAAEEGGATSMQEKWHEAEESEEDYARRVLKERIGALPLDIEQELSRGDGPTIGTVQRIEAYDPDLYRSLLAHYFRITVPVPRMDTQAQRIKAAARRLSALKTARGSSGDRVDGVVRSTVGNRHFRLLRRLRRTALTNRPRSK
jgi:hypothetical protein